MVVPFKKRFLNRYINPQNTERGVFYAFVSLGEKCPVGIVACMNAFIRMIAQEGGERFQ